MDAGQAFEVQGEWWLPERDDMKVSGTLRFDPEAGAELLLIGAFRGILDEGELADGEGVTTITLTTEAIEQAGIYPRIHGVANGSLYHLEDCFRRQMTSNMLGLSRIERVTVNRVLKGAHFSSDEELEADGLWFDIRYFTHWIGKSAIKEVHTLATDGDVIKSRSRISLDAHELEDESATLQDGSEILLRHSITDSGDIAGKTIAQNYSLRINAPSVRSIDDLVDVASDMQDLVSIAVARTAQFEAMAFFHPDAQRSLPGRTVPEPIEYFVKWNARDSSDNPKHLKLNEVIFTYEDAGELDGICRWLDCARKYRDALSRVMSSRYGRGMFVSDRLLNRTAALEGFDRIRTGQDATHFRDRLRRCTNLAGPQFKVLVGDVELWLKKVKKHRDDIAHHLGHRVKQGQLEQYFLADSLYWLFVLCMAREAGFPADVFDRIASHDDYAWLSRKVQAII